MWGSLFGGMVRLSLQILCKLEREYVVNGFCRVPGVSGKAHTRLAGPRVLSTSKRQIVFFIGRASRGG